MGVTSALSPAARRRDGGDWLLGGKASRRKVSGLCAGNIRVGGGLNHVTVWGSGRRCYHLRRSIGGWRFSGRDVGSDCPGGGGGSRRLTANSAFRQGRGRGRA